MRRGARGDPEFRRRSGSMGEMRAAAGQEPISLQPRSPLPPEVGLPTEATRKAGPQNRSFCAGFSSELGTFRAEPWPRACILAAREPGNGVLKYTGEGRPEGEFSRTKSFSEDGWAQPQKRQMTLCLYSKHRVGNAGACHPPEVG